MILQVAKLSLHTGFPSEYTCMIMLQTNIDKQAPDVARSIKVWKSFFIKAAW